MRRALILLLLLPAAATAAPVRAPQPAPSLLGAPYLFRDGDGMARLVFRTDAPLPRRCDGPRRSLGTVDGAAEEAHCYTPAARFNARLGRRYRAVIAAQPDDSAAARRPLGC